MLAHTDDARKFYKSRAWRECRDAYFNNAHGLCERCGGAGRIVHHVNYIDSHNINDPRVTLNHDNLELLCQTCHNKEHHGTKEEPLRDGFIFTADGDIVPIPDTNGG